MGKNDSKKVPTREEYYVQIERFKDISLKLGRAVKYDEMAEYNLRSTRWYVQYCDNPKVSNFSEFIEYEIGMMPRYNVSKENAIKYALELQESLGRPILKKDLKGAINNGIGQGAINSYWGSFTKMKEELGLKMVGRNLRDKEQSIFKIKRDIVVLCAYILQNENRITLTSSDWKKIKMSRFSSCNKWFCDCGLSMREFINSIGFELVESGRGLNYFFEDDSEITRSQYELDFTKKLRSMGLQYNKDYMRDVRYGTFIDTYNGMLDCDYVINYKNRIIYVEIAGMLRDYKSWYLNNKSINSKSKENYRIKLLQKENMMKSQGLEYYILFPEDLNEEKYIEIFN